MINRKFLHRWTANIIIALFILTLFIVLNIHTRNENNQYFEVTIMQNKRVFKPNDTMSIKIIVKDRETGRPVTDANVSANMKIYQGGITERINLLADDEGFYEIEQRLITKNILGIQAKEIGNGLYLIEKRIDTRAIFGGITLKIEIQEDTHRETVERVITFMGFSSWLYAVSIVIASAVSGLVIGFIFGGFYR